MRGNCAVMFESIRGGVRNWCITHRQCERDRYYASGYLELMEKNQGTAMGFHDRFRGNYRIRTCESLCFLGSRTRLNLYCILWRRQAYNPEGELRWPVCLQNSGGVDTGITAKKVAIGVTTRYFSRISNGDRPPFLLGLAFSAKRWGEYYCLNGSLQSGQWWAGGGSSTLVYAL